MSTIDTIRALVAEHSGVALHRLTPETRLSEDAGFDERSALDFFTALAARHDIELAGLWKRWDRHFGKESLPLRAWALLPAALIATPLLAGWLGDLLYLTRMQQWVLAIGLLAAQGWVAHRLLPRRAKQPIRIADVAAAVDRGRW